MPIGKIEPGAPESQSADLMAGNLAQLRALFPELVTEGPKGPAINVDVLKGLVGDLTVTDADEKYGLNWHGKRAARQLALTPSTGTLRPCPDESVDWDTTQNLMIEGDNLEVLKLLQKSYAGKVKMIYIDPPYNTGKDFVYPDNFHESIRNYMELTGQVEGGRKISSNTEAGGRFHTDWLNMIYPRLLLARNLLRSDGVIFISIDDHEVSNLKALCDEIFGDENCKGVLIWQHSVQPKGYSGTFSVHHNFILCYQKSDDFELVNTERSDEHNVNYSNPDNDPRGAWRSGDVRNALYRPNLIYPIDTPSGKTIQPPQNGWRWSRSTVEQKIQTGEIVFSKDESRIIRKIYLDTLDGRTPETILFGKEVGTTRDAAAEVKVLFDGKMPFDTPKPTGLIQHLLSVSGVKSGEVVLDFFAGSGTTGHAVLKANVEQGLSARFILVQLPEPILAASPAGTAAESICSELGIEVTVSSLTRERLRRVARELASKDLLGDVADVGFKSFRLDASNILSWDGSSGSLEQAVLGYIDPVKSGRSDVDIFSELLLRLGLDLSTSVQVRVIHGQTVRAVGRGVLFSCFDRTISADAEVLAAGILAWWSELSPTGSATFVCLDNAFVDDVMKTNLVVALEQGGITRVRSI